MNTSVPIKRSTVDINLPAGVLPPLSTLADLASWNPAHFGPLVWREAFDMVLEQRSNTMFEKSDPDGYLAKALSLLPSTSRRRFLRTPAVATILRRDVGDQFNGWRFAKLLLAELAATGEVAELPESVWTPRGDRFLDRSMPMYWGLPEVILGNTGITIDEQSSFQFPDDEFGIAGTMPHAKQEREVVVFRVHSAIDALRKACLPALEMVTTIIEVLAFRRESVEATAFYSSTFVGWPGLVRFTNAHLPDADTAAILEALVHEAIHCILHVHEEIEGTFLRSSEAAQRTMISPWTGAKIRLHSYIHACVVWYGIYWLWSREWFGCGIPQRRLAMLKARAHRGFKNRPVRMGLAPFNSLVTDSIRELLQEIEDRMLSLT